MMRRQINCPQTASRRTYLLVRARAAVTPGPWQIGSERLIMPRVVRAGGVVSTYAQKDECFSVGSLFD